MIFTFPSSLKFSTVPLKTDIKDTSGRSRRYYNDNKSENDKVIKYRDNFDC